MRVNPERREEGGCLGGGAVFARRGSHAQPFNSGGKLRKEAAHCGCGKASWHLADTSVAETWLLYALGWLGAAVSPIYADTIARR